MSDDAELVKAGMQGFAEGAMRPFNDLLLALFGPAATEVGLILKESVQNFRYKRQARFFGQTKEVLTNANIEPDNVPLKLLIPIIENASNEEEDDLQDIWANLLANAADPSQESEVYPSFPAILKEMTTRDVKFLDGLFTDALAQSKQVRGSGMSSVEDVKFHPKMLRAVYSKAGLEKHQGRRGLPTGRARTEDVHADARDMSLSIDTFARHGVITRVYGLTRNKSDVGSLHAFTTLGARFVRACRAPKNAG